MKSKILAIFFCWFLGVFSFGQSDSAIVPVSLDLPDAVFISYSDFRHNKGVLKDQIVSPLNKDLLDFVGKTLEKEMFSFSDGQKTTAVHSNIIWGYFQNKTLYLNYKGSFYRVPVFGSICYLVATVEIAGVGFYDPMFGPGGSSGRRQEVREFLMNFYDGIVQEFKMDEAELLISRDKLVYDEFKKLNRRQQKEQIFRYVRKYNEAHPVYFLK